MAQIVFSQIGAAVGARLLPAGLGVLGWAVSGAAIGRAAGALAGGALDRYLAGPMEGPRLKALHVMEAAEGAGIPSVYGRTRVAGHLIWAARFRERRTTRSAGGKGGPRVNEYSYSVSFAVALGEGPGVRVVRAWANGEAFDLSGTVHRLYDGSEGQVPDPLIEMVEGTAPAIAEQPTSCLKICRSTSLATGCRSCLSRLFGCRREMRSLGCGTA